MLSHDVLQFEFGPFLISLSIKKSRDNGWEKEKESVMHEFALFEKVRLSLKLEGKLISQLFEKFFQQFRSN